MIIEDVATRSKSPKSISKSIVYEKMIDFSERLAEGIPFVCTVLYEIDNKLYFGEITFFPISGFEGFTPESAEELGNWIKLSEPFGGPLARSKEIRSIKKDEGYH